MLALSHSRWTAAFVSAIEVEEHVKGFLLTGEPTNQTLSTSISTIITRTNRTDFGVHGDDIDGFPQSQHVALVARRSNPSFFRSADESINDTTAQQCGAEQQRKIDMEKSNMGRQVCSAWLTHHFFHNYVD